MQGACIVSAAWFAGEKPTTDCDEAREIVAEIPSWVVIKDSGGKWDERKRNLHDAANDLLDKGKGNEECVRVREACDIARQILSNPYMKRRRLISRLTVLLGGRMLSSERNFASLKLGRELFKLLSDSDIGVKVANGAYMSIIG